MEKADSADPSKKDNQQGKTIPFVYAHWQQEESPSSAPRHALGNRNRLPQNKVTEAYFVESDIVEQLK
jgi:hypothetical protein